MKLDNINYILFGLYEVVYFLDLLVYYVQENVFVVYIDGQQCYDVFFLMRQDVVGDYAS